MRFIGVQIEDPVVISSLELEANILQLEVYKKNILLTFVVNTDD